MLPGGQCRLDRFGFGCFSTVKNPIVHPLRPALLHVNIFGLFLEAAAHDCCFRLYETAEVIGPALGLYAVVVARL